MIKSKSKREETDPYNISVCVYGYPGTNMTNCTMNDL